MTRRNYNRISQDNNKPADIFETAEDVFEETTEAVETEEEPAEEPAIETVPVDVKQGRVYGCQLLIVRTFPKIDSEIVTRIRKGEEVTFEEEIDGCWVAVTTAMGIEGYCLKEFIKEV